MIPLMVERPQSVEVDIEEFKRRAAAHERLVELKVDAAHVYRVWEEYESDRVVKIDGVLRQAAVIIFLDSKRAPRTALLVDDTLIVQPGWHGDHRLPRRKD